jgi:hypothetical protein
MKNQEAYDRGFFQGRNQKPFDVSEEGFYEEGYRDGLDQWLSKEVNLVAISRIIEAQKKGRLILDFLKDLEYYRENEF